MNKVIVDSVHEIANFLYREKGYVITIKKVDVAIVLEALELLSKKIKGGNNGENKDKG